MRLKPISSFNWPKLNFPCSIFRELPRRTASLFTPRRQRKHGGPEACVSALSASYVQSCAQLGRTPSFLLGLALSGRGITDAIAASTSRFSTIPLHFRTRSPRSRRLAQPLHLFYPPLSLSAPDAAPIMMITCSARPRTRARASSNA
jgi:hypothetical protein